VRPCASLLLSIAGLATAVGAQASPPAGQPGATSSASIRISVSVRPRVQVSALTVSRALSDSPAASLRSPDGICLIRGGALGNFAVMLQPAGYTSTEAPSIELHPDAAAATTCRSLVPNSVADTAAGYRLPPASPAARAPYNLLIVPE
jgi:hypothetical protein